MSYLSQTKTNNSFFYPFAHFLMISCSDFLLDVQDWNRYQRNQQKQCKKVNVVLFNDFYHFNEEVFLNNSCIQKTSRKRIFCFAWRSRRCRYRCRCRCGCSFDFRGGFESRSEKTSQASTSLRSRRRRQIHHRFVAVVLRILKVWKCK